MSLVIRVVEHSHAANKSSSQHCSCPHQVNFNRINSLASIGIECALSVVTSSFLTIPSPGIHIQLDTQVQRVRLPRPTAPKVVRSGALFGVVVVDQAQAVDCARRGRCLPHAGHRNHHLHTHPVCRTLCLQVLATIVAEEEQRLLLEESQFDVLLPGSTSGLCQQKSHVSLLPNRNCTASSIQSSWSPLTTLPRKSSPTCEKDKLRLCFRRASSEYV